jgi:hypothetical protein
VTDANDAGGAVGDDPPAELTTEEEATAMLSWRHPNYC